MLGFLLRRGLSTSKLVKFEVFVESTGKSVALEAPKGTPLAQVLKDGNIPLPFECGFKCECGTCAIEFKDKSTFENVLKEQPPAADEKSTLGSLDAPIRLSCQLKVSDALELSLIHI
eukprot:TRINITY_DN9819_c0_g1_i1.p1 TRINITY_DN9819_c0_g1~~TRINITY_DN9819_c0_g1_i1.p1  ORF type:complete len:117 (-),score=5.51 TRINITY_DN9819_c0_g1_i1:60-410(-)